MANKTAFLRGPKIYCKGLGPLCCLPYVPFSKKQSFVSLSYLRRKNGALVCVLILSFLPEPNQRFAKELQIKTSSRLVFPWLGGSSSLAFVHLILKNCHIYTPITHSNTFTGYPPSQAFFKLHNKDVMVKYLEQRELKRLNLSITI